MNTVVHLFYSLTFSFFAVRSRAFGNSQFDKASLSLFSLGNMENSKGSAAAKEKLNSKKGCIGIQDESITVFPFFLLLPQYGHQFVTEKMDYTMLLATFYSDLVFN